MTMMSPLRSPRGPEHTPAARTGPGPGPESVKGGKAAIDAVAAVEPHAAAVLSGEGPSLSNPQVRGPQCKSWAATACCMPHQVTCGASLGH
jgi:hypothetical protein